MGEPRTSKARPGASEWQAQKSVKQLNVTGVVGAYMKEWFMTMRDRVTRGEPFAIGGEAAEIFTVMDIPLINLNWWSGNIAAKQLAPYYFDLLDEKGYDACRYCALGLGCTMDNNPERAPWGGLPKPTVILGHTLPLADCDAGQRITELWAREYDTFHFPLEVTYPTRLNPRWWERMRDHWDEIIEPYRIDLRVEELKALIRFLEIKTGKVFSVAKLREVMKLADEQDEYMTKVRDLIALTVPSPVGLAEVLSAYRIQWHRGTKAGRDLARMFYEEVKERADKGEAACPNEKLRMMWRGVGLWHNPAFYQYFEEKYGAVFITSLYLAFTANLLGPRKVFDDPLRALASRSIPFLGVGSSAWQVKEAKLNQVNGVIQLVSQDCRENIATPIARMAFEKAGIPILPVYTDNVDARQWDDAKIRSQVSNFIETRLLKRRVLN